MLLLSPLEVSWAYQQTQRKEGAHLMTPMKWLHLLSTQDANKVLIILRDCTIKSYTLNFIFYSVAEMGFREKVFFLA